MNRRKTQTEDQSSLTHFVNMEKDSEKGNNTWNFPVALKLGAYVNGAAVRTCDMLLTALHDYTSSIVSRLRYLETLVICEGTFCPRPPIPSYLFSLFLLGLDHLLHLALCVCILQSLDM